MWKTLTMWFAGRAVNLVWKFLENLARSRADDPRLATFIKEQIVIYQAGSPLGGKEKLFAVADAALAYAKGIGLDIAYSTMVTLSAALFDELAPKLSEMVNAWIAKRTKGVAL